MSELDQITQRHEDSEKPCRSNNKNIRSDNASHRFQKGNQFSKGKGRPKSKFISEALKNALESGEADFLGKRVVQIAKKSKPSQSLTAISLIADRTEGKPVQSHRIEHAIDDQTAKVLAELAAKLL